MHVTYNVIGLLILNISMVCFLFKKNKERVFLLFIVIFFIFISLYNDRVFNWLDYLSEMVIFTFCLFHSKTKKQLFIVLSLIYWIYPLIITGSS